MPSASTLTEFKQAAAESAIARVMDGMIVGLGTGSTAVFAVSALGKRVQQGLRVVGIPTSEKTAEQARGLGIPLSTLAEHSQIDLTIDGADEVELGTLNLIKGHGGALLREKIVASASARLIIIVDETKLVERLGIDRRSRSSRRRRPRSWRGWERIRLCGSVRPAVSRSLPMAATTFWIARLARFHHRQIWTGSWIASWGWWSTVYLSA